MSRRNDCPRSGDGDPGDATRGQRRILHFLPDLAMGGGQQVLCRHIAAMDPRQFSHHVVYFQPIRDTASAYEQAGAMLHDLGPWRLRSAPRILLSLLSLIRRERIDLLHTNGTPVDKLHGQLAAWLCDLPLVTTLHGMRPRPGRPSLRPRALLAHCTAWVLRIAERVLDRLGLAAVIAVSDAVLDDWRGHLTQCGIDPERIEVVYSGLPLDEYVAVSRERAGPRLRETLGLAPDTPLIVTVSRLQAGKRNQLLIPILRQVVERIAEAKLLIVGEGPERLALEAAIREAGLTDSIRLLGFRDDVPSLLAAADVFVFCSGQEGFGLVVIEAMAAGLPVVSPALPSLQRLVAQGAPLQIADPGDPLQFAHAICALLENPDRAAGLGAAGLRIVREQWDVQISARRYEQIYRSLIDARSASPVESSRR